MKQPHAICETYEGKAGKKQYQNVRNNMSQLHDIKCQTVFSIWHAIDYNAMCWPLKFRWISRICRYHIMNWKLEIDLNWPSRSRPLKFKYYTWSLDKQVHIFWEGHKILRNLPLTFDYSTFRCGRVMADNIAYAKFRKSLLIW